MKPIGTIVEGPNGLSMPESTARRIEELAGSLPKDFVYRRIARKSTEFKLDAGERTDVSVITTDALDHDGEVVLPGGIDWSGYNRVVTFAHRYDQLPVGSNWWMRARGNGLIAKTHYPPRPADWGDAAPWLPSAVLHLMQQPVATCTGKSIGFLPLHIREATADERSRRPELAGVPIIDKAAGLEYAVAPVPCNPEAQMQAVAKGRELGVIDEPLANLLMEMGAGEGTAGPERSRGEARRHEGTEGRRGETDIGPAQEESNLMAIGAEAESHGAFVRAMTLRAALERQLSQLRPEVVEQVQRQIRDVFCAATGRVC
jgi:hypothetical protein